MSNKDVAIKLVRDALDDSQCEADIIAFGPLAGELAMRITKALDEKDLEALNAMDDGHRFMKSQYIKEEVGKPST